LDREKSWDDQLQFTAGRRKGVLDGSYSLVMLIFKSDATCIVSGAPQLKTIFTTTTLKGQAFLRVTGKLCVQPQY